MNASTVVSILSIAGLVFCAFLWLMSELYFAYFYDGKANGEDES